MNKYIASFGSSHLKDYDLDAENTIVIIEGETEDMARAELMAEIGTAFSTTYPIDALKGLVEKYSLNVINIDELKESFIYNDFDFETDTDIIYLNDELNGGELVASSELTVYVEKGTRVKHDGDSGYETIDGSIFADTMPVSKFINRKSYGR